MTDYVPCEGVPANGRQIAQDRRPTSTGMVVYPDLRRGRRGPQSGIPGWGEWAKRAEQRRRPSFQDAYDRGVAHARAMLGPRKASKGHVPEGKRGLASSILASPYVQSWPYEVREWLHTRLDGMVTRDWLWLPDD